GYLGGSCIGYDGAHGLLAMPLDTDQGGGLRNEGHPIDLAERSLDIALGRGMGHDDHRHSLPFLASLLEHRRNADAVASQDARDLREDPGSVLHHEPHVIEGRDLLHARGAERATLDTLTRRRW